MKLWDAIVDLRKQVADVNSKLADHGQVIAGAVDADQFKALSDTVAALPTKDDLASAVSGINDEIGTEPADAGVTGADPVVIAPAPAADAAVQPAPVFG